MEKPPRVGLRFSTVLVAELAGHRRLETTRRYSLPSKTDRQAAVAAADLEIEF